MSHSIVNSVEARSEVGRLSQEKLDVDDVGTSGTLGSSVLIRRELELRVEYC